MNAVPSVKRSVCFYCVASHLGGAERSTLDLIKEIACSDRYEAWALLPHRDGAFADALRETGIPIEYLEMPASFFKTSRDRPYQALAGVVHAAPGLARYAVRLTTLFKSRKTLLIHTTGIKCHLLAALLLPIHRRSVLWHIRDILPQGAVLAGFQVLLRAVQRAFPKRLDVVFNSQSSAQAFNLPHPRVVHNGLNADQYSARRSDFLHRKFGLHPETPLIGILGVFARWKGQLDFVQMANQLIKEGSRAHFVIIGGRIYDTVSDLNYEQELQNAVRSSAAAERIHFSGYLPNPIEAFSSLQILVHASTRPEPFGRVILEAMACGVPVVAAGAGGVLELIEDGKNGLLFSPGDAVQMGKQVTSLLEDPVRATRLAANAKATFENAFTLQAHTTKIIALYDELLGSGGSNPIPRAKVRATTG